MLDPRERDFSSEEVSKQPPKEKIHGFKDLSESFLVNYSLLAWRLASDKPRSMHQNDDAWLQKWNSRQQLWKSRCFPYLSPANTDSTFSAAAAR